MTADLATTQAIQTYLADLEMAIRGADSALIYDALIDAATHLRSAVASGQTVAAAIESYGTPTEIASAYLREEPSVKGAIPARASVMTVNPVAISSTKSATLRRIPIVGIFFDPYAWGSVAFLTFGFAFALVAFVWVMSVGSLALGLLPTLLGIPLLIALLGSSRAISLFMGKIIEFLVGIRMPHRTYRVDVAGVDGFWRRIWLWIKDIRGWMTVGFLIGNFPVALFFFCTIVIFLSMSMGLIFGSVAEMFGANSMMVSSDTDLSIFGAFYGPDKSGHYHITLPTLILLFFAGIVLLIATLWLSKAVAFTYAQVVKAIQVVRPQ